MKTYEKKSGFLGVLSIAASLAMAAGIAATGPVSAHAMLPLAGAGASIQTPAQTARIAGTRLKTTSDAKLRAKGSNKAKVLLRIPKGTVLKSTQAPKSGWYKIAYKDKAGYVSSKSVKLMPKKPTDTSKPTLQAPARYELGFIVNKDHKLSSSYKPALKTIPGTSKQLTPEAVTAFSKMRKAAKKDGISLTAVSGYRSYARQKELFASYSRKLGAKEADRVSARPGTSEHQTGLAIDVGAANGRCVISKCFADTREGKWVAKYSYKYGFIMRYPKGTEKYTGYDFEPWHYRYVGTAIAKDMKNKKIKTLERYYTR
ncbi:D-alanyl-D-alanine carboxypeptidase family protein [Paeniglutamicibacter sp. NPDC012692]|uniref:D-alanyl-D-alanine carboxypeptidase family protein n=1 Tax=Paeniglutamicibacter sp. NPDC012692 TaxID=3364388 RepID=UPI0036C5AD61